MLVHHIVNLKEIWINSGQTLPIYNKLFSRTSQIYYCKPKCNMHRLAFGQKFVFSAIINIHLESSYKCNKFNNKREKPFFKFFSLYSSMVIELVTPALSTYILNFEKLYFHNLAVHFKSFIVSEMGLIANPKGNRPLTATSLPTLNNARKHFWNSGTK